ncbi:DUF1643 domain-containing protein [Leptolyngbya sp. AN02str]|uniref:DUF1643 domain-containing protein n=1 Tax=Leptolyngbya sp. AN02str TaxID=3423363 RepID=UPI003D30FE3F
MVELRDSNAVFDATGTYRYTLWREWDAALPRLAFVMLNPSTATAIANDPTIRRCIGFAQAWGFGAVEVVNLFAYRSTHPQQLRLAADPVGTENDWYVQQAAEKAEIVVLAWGNWGYLQARDRTMYQLLASYNPQCLGLTKTGQPRHPLYLRRDVVLRPMPNGAHSADERLEC